MPEGDTIHRAAAPHPRGARRACAARRSSRPIRAIASSAGRERLAGRTAAPVDAHGKHLFLRFEGGLTLHSHLRMTGLLGRRAAQGERWRRPRAAPGCVLRGGGWEVVAVRRARARADERRPRAHATRGWRRSART